MAGRAVYLLALLLAIAFTDAAPQGAGPGTSNSGPATAESDEAIQESLEEALGEEGQTGPEHEHCSTAGEDYVKPNIVFILTDDMGFNDIGWNNEEVVSPNLKDLADNGIILDRNYVQPVCSPSRGALITGKYGFRIGMQHNVISPSYPECLDLGERTLAQEMKDLGYATHYLGKWHLGFCNWACTPTERGFDSFYGFFNGYVDHYNHEIEDALATFVARASAGGYDWWDGREPAVNNNGSYANDLITERAVEIISNHRPYEPLYMFISQATVHTPIQVAPGVEPTPIDENDPEAAMRADYLKMVTSLDDSVGEVVQALKDQGLYDNTIIVFSSDNGGEHGPSSNRPLRGEKATIFEGGTRVPGMVHSPLQTQTGLRHEGSIHITDWYPTFVALGGGCTDDLPIDGKDQSNMILNGGPSIRNEFVYNLDDVTPYTFGMAAFRMGDFKMILGYPGLYDGWEQDGNIDQTHIVDTYGINGDSSSSDSTSHRRKRGNYNFDWGAIGAYVAQVQDRVLLYNVMDDPEEKHDLSAEHPELVQVMKGRLMDLYEEVSDVIHYDSDPASDPSLTGGVWTPGWC